jgi:pimeloyl-ACP methyl ester carboxylesterase
VAFDAPAHGQSDGETSSVVDIGRAMLAIARAHGPFDAVVAHSVGSPAALYAFAHGLTTRASVHIAGPASLERVLIARSRLAGLPADIQAKIADMELESLARGFRHPALLLHAPDDGEIPFAESEALNRAWPGSRLVPLPGLGHRRIIGAAETIGLVTGFLDQQLRADATAAA